MENIFFNTLPIFLITILGSLIKKHWINSSEFWRGLEKLSYYVLFPAVIFNSIILTDLASSNTSKLTTGLMLSTIIVSIGLIFYRHKKKMNKMQFTSIFQGSTRYNSYILFGVSNALFDDQGLAIVSVMSAYMMAFTNILAIIIFIIFVPNKETHNTKKDIITSSIKIIYTNPLIISSILGFAFNYFGGELNLGVQKTISSVADSAFAIGMFNIGASLKFVSLKDYYPQLILTSIVKLLILPLVTFLILLSMSIEGMDQSIGILYSTLPCASSSYTLSKQLGGDHDLMSSIITFTTIVSVISLPVMMYVFG